MLLELFVFSFYTGIITKLNQIDNVCNNQTHHLKITNFMIYVNMSNNIYQIIKM